MVGGEAGDLERARPVLDRLARRVFHLGPLGTGAVMKLAVNTLIFGLNGAVAEGLVLAERNGIDRALAYEVLAVERGRRADGRLQAGELRRARHDPRRVLAGPRRQGPAAHPPSLPSASDTSMPQAAVNLDTIQAAERSMGEHADFSRSRVTCVRRAGDDRSAMRRASRQEIVQQASDPTEFTSRGNDR